MSVDLDSLLDEAEAGAPFHTIAIAIRSLEQRIDHLLAAIDRCTHDIFGPSAKAEKKEFKCCDSDSFAHHRHLATAALRLSTPPLIVVSHLPSTTQPIQPPTSK
ncbi:unnamed protein product [Cylicocyclus nassatus]|uniref:Uncharacterized protein n=1 Tax=Cylicocyclus nassatus TaxID=53992 RepID=A0AA36MF64_CYLNA|nr:unnamed protein product [Cylicocyclus nassatus]